MNKFQVGDIVRISTKEELTFYWLTEFPSQTKEDFEEVLSYNEFDPFKKCLGKLSKIINIDSCIYIGKVEETHYRLEIDGGKNSWPEGVLFPAPTKITFNKNG